LYKIPAKTLFIGHSMVFMPECHSTSDELARLLEANPSVPEGTTVITNNQTSGRGQRGNTWISEPGKNLTFSLLIKPAFLQAMDQFSLNKAFSLGMLDYLRSVLDADIKVKWPNDIMINHKKACGILIENHVQGSAIQHSMVGIGLNVNQDHFSLSTATSLKLQAARDFLLGEVLTDLLSCLEGRYLQLRSENMDVLDSDYRAALYWAGERHLFKKAEEIFEGEITGVDAFGKLKVFVDGTTEYFDLKQIQFLK
jgi:BirA family transcriptional regulator, biotin operon repressor / biotin---[acetyl-CoA-carboxylase] ligase